MIRMGGIPTTIIIFEGYYLNYRKTIIVFPLLIAISAFSQIAFKTSLMFSLSALKVISITSDEIKELLSFDKFLILLMTVI